MGIEVGVIAAVGLGLSAVGTGVSIAGQYQARQAQEDAERARKAQMDFDAARKQMAILRNMQQTQALGLANATSQGAQYGSGYEGGQAEISGNAGFNYMGVSGAQQFGSQIFDANMRASEWGSVAMLGQGAASLGSSLTNPGFMNAYANVSAQNKNPWWGPYSPSNFASNNGVGKYIPYGKY